MALTILGTRDMSGGGYDLYQIDAPPPRVGYPQHLMHAARTFAERVTSLRWFVVTMRVDATLRAVISSIVVSPLRRRLSPPSLCAPRRTLARLSQLRVFPCPCHVWPIRTSQVTQLGCLFLLTAPDTSRRSSRAQNNFAVGRQSRNSAYKYLNIKWKQEHTTNAG